MLEKTQRPDPDRGGKLTNHYAVRYLERPPLGTAIADHLPEAAALAQELLNFKVKVTEAAHETFGADGNRYHDDLVMAVAMAAWQGEHMRRQDVFA